MFLLSLAMVALPAAGLGAPYPAATFDRAITQSPCRTSYGFITSDPIAKVIAFYRAEAMRAGVPSVAESPATDRDFRMLLFARKPQLLSVLLERTAGRTTARVLFHRLIPTGCA